MGSRTKPNASASTTPQNQHIQMWIRSWPSHWTGKVTGRYPVPVQTDATGAETILITTNIRRCHLKRREFVVSRNGKTVVHASETLVLFCRCREADYRRNGGRRFHAWSRSSGSWRDDRVSCDWVVSTSLHRYCSRHITPGWIRRGGVGGRGGGLGLGSE